MCNNWPDLPNGMERATGGLIGDTVIICGVVEYICEDDYCGDYECYSLTSDKATLISHISGGRKNAASIVLNDHTLYVTGGYDYGKALKTKYTLMDGDLVVIHWLSDSFGEARI